MAADGEVSVKVHAEGVDDAAEEMSGGGGGGGGGGDGEGEGGGSDLVTAIKGGVIGGLLAQGFKPLIDVLDPILKILQAFLAPLAVMLMRLLSPVLRFLIKLLPAWFNFIQFVDRWLSNAAEWLRDLPGRIWNFLRDLPGMIWSFMTDLPGMIWDFMTDLPGMIWDFMKDLPGMIWEKTKQGAEWINETLGGLPGDIWDFMKSLPGMIWDKVKQLASMIAQKINQTVPGANIPETQAQLGGEASRRFSGPAKSATDTRTGTTGEIILRGGLEVLAETAERTHGVDFIP